jgi:hypothetical protein
MSTGTDDRIGESRQMHNQKPRINVSNSNIMSTVQIQYVNDSLPAVIANIGPQCHGGLIIHLTHNQQLAAASFGTS